ncbi:hypothetical protein ACFY0R_20420 [Streptomyces sp. NPDC001633]|uniref:hypothetical protein n=1 Tax=Streptomyces sp. NPDC001633 TaxID=3364595 RepID=UPI0036A63C50
MGTILAAAAGFPTLVFTAALVVLVVFWLLVAAGVTDPRSFDADADVEAWGMGGVPVAVAFSVLTVVAWLVSLSFTVLMDPLATPGVARALIRLPVLAVALLIAWRAARLLVRPLRRLFPDEPGLPRPDVARPARATRTAPAGSGPGPTEAAAQEDAPVTQLRLPGASPHPSPHDTALAPRRHAA